MVFVFGVDVIWICIRDIKIDKSGINNSILDWRMLLRNDLV